jgi:hypothetical protein
MNEASLVANLNPEIEAIRLPSGTEARRPKCGTRFSSERQIS